VPRRPAPPIVVQAAPHAAPPPSMAPVNLSGLVGDDWDGETVVKKPAALTTSRHRDRPSGRDSGRHAQAQQQQPQQQQQQQQKPFNADETVNLRDGDIEVEVDFGDETHNIGTPPRRTR
jgi:hypothetical protein